MNTSEAWQVTFPEFWALFHQVNGTAAKPKPMTGKQFEALHDAWAKGSKDGNA